MKAILYTKYGTPDGLQLREVDKPSPKDNEVLVRVIASSVNALEWRMFSLPKFFVRIIGGGLREPKNKSIGGDLAGRVEAVGAAVKQFRPGDAVFGISRGAFAEYVCASEDKLVLKPADISFEAAATVPIAGLTALQLVRDQGQVQAGQKVLISGAGGGVGTFAVQIAKAFGADVTAACSKRNMDIARSSGADHVIDYAQEDCTKTAQLFDVILAINGYHPIRDYMRALKPGGIYAVAGGELKQFLEAILLGRFVSSRGKTKVLGMITKPNQKDLTVLKEILEAGKIAPVIDRSYPLAEVADAVRYLMEGHPRGKVVITTECKQLT